MRTLRGWLLGASILVGCATTFAAEQSRMATRLPAFSEEREAAALVFVKKQAPDLVAILEKLRTDDAKKYQQEIREIFHVSDLLTDLREDDERRYLLELEVWKTETKALLLVAKMASLSEEELEAAKKQLQDQTTRLVDLEAEVLRLQVQDLENELKISKGQLAKAEEKREVFSKERYDKLLDEAKRRGILRQ